MPECVSCVPRPCRSVPKSRLTFKCCIPQVELRAGAAAFGDVMGGGVTLQALGLPTDSWLACVGKGAEEISFPSGKRVCGMRWGKLNPRKYSQLFVF